MRVRCHGDANRGTRYSSHRGIRNVVSRRRCPRNGYQMADLNIMRCSYCIGCRGTNPRCCGYTVGYLGPIETTRNRKSCANPGPNTHSLNLTRALINNSAKLMRRVHWVGAKGSGGGQCYVRLRRIHRRGDRRHVADGETITSFPELPERHGHYRSLEESVCGYFSSSPIPERVSVVEAIRQVLGTVEGRKSVVNPSVDERFLCCPVWRDVSRLKSFTQFPGDRAQLSTVNRCIGTNQTPAVVCAPIRS